MEKELTKIHNYSDKKLEEYFATYNLKTLHELKLYLDDLYYNTGDNICLKDYQYDMLKDILTIRDPGYIPPIGAKIRYGDNATDLPYWLGSMDKFKPENVSDLERWLDKNKAEEYIIEDKLDGVSCLLTVVDSKVKLYTRGDGKTGSDITYLTQYFRNIPIKINENIAVRGELIIDLNTFKLKYSKDNANPRNMVAGRVGGKTIREGLNDIQFIAYELILPEKIQIKASDQLEKLTDLGFKTVNYSIVDNITIENLIESFILAKQQSPFEIDGIIVQANVPYIRNISGNPKYAFAFKVRLDSNVIEAEVQEVEWSISKWGLIKPKIRINPIQLSGVTITYTTGFNAKYIENNNIGPGTIIKITRSGDVIPYIVSIVKSTQAQMPSIPYIWNETHVDILTEENETIMCIKLIASFFASLKIKFVSEATVDKMYKAGFDNILKILSAEKKDFEKIEGFGARLAERTHENIHSGLKNISLSELLGASGIFGMGIGKRKVEVLINAIPDLLTIYKNIPSIELIDLINNVEGFSDKTTDKIVQNLPWADKFIDSLKDFVTFKMQKKVSDDLKDMKVVFSGFRDSDIEDKVVKRGGKVITSVSKNTTILVVADKDVIQSKAQKAIALGIPIYNKEEFVETFGL